jgi:hypothetical protein
VGSAGIQIAGINPLLRTNKSVETDSCVVIGVRLGGANAKQISWQVYFLGLRLEHLQTRTTSSLFSGMNRSALQRDCAISGKLARKIWETDLFLRKKLLERMRGAEAERHFSVFFSRVMAQLLKSGGGYLN